MVSTFILNQKEKSISALPLGEGVVSGMGCEAVALYNALVYFGGKPDFPSLLSELSDEHLLWRKGKWGIAPSQMKKYLETRGFSTRYLGKKELSQITSDTLRDKKEALLVTCFNKSFFQNGVHSFVVVPDGASTLLSPNGYIASAKTITELFAKRIVFRAIIVGAQRVERS